MTRLTRILIGAGFILAIQSARAQITGAMQQADTAEERRQREQTAQSYAAGESAPELYDGESSDVGPQSVLKLKPRKTWFEAMADAQYFYTDNMFLTEHNKQAADVLVSTAQFALAPTPYPLADGTFAPRLGYRHQWFDFGLAKPGPEISVLDFQTHTIRPGHLDDFDFNAQTVFADGRWSRNHWIIEGGFDFTRLMTTADYLEFYKEYVPRIGVQRLLPVTDRTAFSLGYTGDYRFTDAPTFFRAFDRDFDDRTDHAFSASLTQVLCAHAILQPYYQFKYTHFTHSSVGTRNDYLNSVGLALYCIVCPNFEIRGYFDYSRRNSDNSAVAAYRQLDAGGGVNVTFKF